MPPRLTHEQYAARFEGQPITLLSEYHDSRTAIKCQCHKCGSEFDFMPHQTRKGELPRCLVCHPIDRGQGARVLKPIELVQKALALRPDVELIGEYKGATKKALFRCTDCGNKWRTICRCVTSEGRGCPKCAKIRSQPSRLFPHRTPLQSRLKK